MTALVNMYLDNTNASITVNVCGMAVIDWSECINDGMSLFRFSLANDSSVNSIGGVVNDAFMLAMMGCVPSSKMNI